MQEVRVAKLGKPDVEMLKELTSLDEQIQGLIAEMRSKHSAMWGAFRIKYGLNYGVTHYIKKNVIYKQAIE